MCFSILIEITAFQMSSLLKFTKKLLCSLVEVFSKKNCFNFGKIFMNLFAVFMFFFSVLMNL